MNAHRERFDIDQNDHDTLRHDPIFQIVCDQIPGAECHVAGTNRRAIVTNRAGAMIVPAGVYNEYVQRGESENRNKELKVDLCGGRLSAHRFLANLFRLYLHALSLNLIIRLCRQLPSSSESTPVEELCHAQPATWRMRIIKVAGEVLVSSRRILIRLSLSWPHLPLWRSVLQTLH